MKVDFRDNFSFSFERHDNVFIMMQWAQIYRVGSIKLKYDARMEDIFWQVLEDILKHFETLINVLA